MCLHHAVFAVTSVMTTTGFGTLDFDKWPMFSKTLLVVLSLIGACAGSTGGGFKFSRLSSFIQIARIKKSGLSTMSPSPLAITSKTLFTNS